MTDILSKEIAIKALADFCREKSFVLFGTGTSCSVDVEFGMGALKDHLLKEVPGIPLSPTQQTQWDSVVKALASDNDLESAMNLVTDDALTNFIVEFTGKFVAALDKKYSVQISSGEVRWPASRLIERLVVGLSETDRKLHVATPNYDLLAEYAFEKAGIPYTTGYVGGVNRQVDWKQAEQSMKYAEGTVPRGKPLIKDKKHVRFYKVHGSLNTFKVNNTSVENNSWMYDVPHGVERLMVTPGTSKFKKLHENRLDLLCQFDQALAEHEAFLFIGFGFNDSQLSNSTIRQKLVDQKCHGLIITRDTNSRIDKLMRESDNLWVVCKHQDHGNEGTRIFNNRYSDWLHLEDKMLWDFEVFATDILGG